MKQNNEKGNEPDEPDFPNGENPSSNNLTSSETNHIDTVIYQNSIENISIPSHAHDTWLFDDEIYVSDEDDYYILNNLPIPIRYGNQQKFQSILLQKHTLFLVSRIHNLLQD